MTGRLTERRFDGSLAEQLSEKVGSAARLLWLGQAGFVIDMAAARLVVDPYLSDSLATKYRGTQYPHRRMMPAPIEPAALAGVDYVLCTHAHTDHMDPGTLPALFAANPSARLVAPRAVMSAALERSGIREERILSVDAGEALELGHGLRIVATRSAHETLERNENGDHRFLGFVLKSRDVTIWHSGDTVPFDGLAEEVKAMQPDVALLPVNGRRPELSTRGVPGNLTLAEAVELSGAIGVATMVAHHYGLFDFNTIEPEHIDAAARSTMSPQLLRARTGTAYEWAPCSAADLSDARRTL